MPTWNSNSHDYFEELCSLSAGGHLPSEEQEELAAHLATCEACRNFHREMLSLTAELTVHAEAVFGSNPTIDSLKESLTEPPAPSSLSEAPQVPGESRLKTRRSWTRPAAAMLLGLLSGAAFMSWHDNRVFSSKQPPQQQKSLAHSSGATIETAQAIDSKASEARIQKLESALALAVAQAKAASETAVRVPASSPQEERAKQVAVLLNRAAEMDAKDALQREQISALTAELEKFRKQHDQNIQSLQARDEQIRLLTADLVTAHAKETPRGRSTSFEEGSSNNSVAELLGQRRLHVIDVYDENSHGQRTTAFGRVFYGEGSYLLFYAFDLPVKLGSDKIVVQAWGQQEGSAKNPVKLGILTQSDPSLPRWMLRVKNPAQFGKINAVFVTMERQEEKRPVGQPMLYAYLRQTPNHP